MHLNKNVLPFFADVENAITFRSLSNFSMTLLFYSPLESTLKQTFRNPFISDRQKLIVHCCHHKVGTAWFIRVLKSISRYYGLNFQCCPQNDLKRDTDIFLEYMSQINPDKLPDFVGSHMIRDPRDIVVSGYFYHLWTKEEWAHIPRKSLKNQTYQAYLNSLNFEAGLLAEMEGTSKEVIEAMSNWNYQSSEFIEFKYEDIIQDEQKVFSQIFKHYGFKDRAIQQCLQLAEQFSFKNISKRSRGTVKPKSHLRSGKIGQWKKLFSDRHKRRFKKLFGDVVVKLGYEANNDW